ncbi:hypothetical protein [Pantoea sp. GD03673]|uniref:hypothetical protein n=1 Tax=Pantoea sp. GD03673 TaxID=2975364 RepID=UPI00244CD8AB|nr:hypothetical protein [Pantoea sp. GD03673]MDH2066247.1 hypothetical protein [Pantoea sp. GD03673]
MDSQTAALLRRLNPCCAQALQPGEPLLTAYVDVSIMASVIADRIGIPLSSLMKDEQAELPALENQLSTRVVLQDAALSAIAQRLHASTMQQLGEVPESIESDMHECLGPILRDNFQPALLARIRTGSYLPLAPEAMDINVERKLKKMSQRPLRHYDLQMGITATHYDTVTDACLLPDTDARDADSLLNQQILPVLSQQPLQYITTTQHPQILQLDRYDEEGVVMEFNAPATEVSCV